MIGSRLLSKHSLVSGWYIRVCCRCGRRKRLGKMAADVEGAKRLGKKAADVEGAKRLGKRNGMSNVIDNMKNMAYYATSVTFKSPKDIHQPAST